MQAHYLHSKSTHIDTSPSRLEYISKPSIHLLPIQPLIARHFILPDANLKRSTSQLEKKSQHETSNCKDAGSLERDALAWTFGC